jgi:Domain of unknown function (DUF932)
MQVQDLRHIPAALAEARHLPTTSESYNFISTRSVLEALIQDSWQIVDAKQSGSRFSDRRLFARHEITLSDPRIQMKEVGDVKPQFYLSNAHDGSAAFRMQAGLERLVCKNGMRVPEGLCQSVAIPHRGSKTIEEIVLVAQSYRENVDQIAKHIRRFKETTLSPAAAVEFVRQAIAIRHRDEPDGTVVIADLLAPKRAEDAGTDLWRTFNRAQEYLIRGGYEVHRMVGEGANKSWATRRARGIKSILEGARINTQLWEVAELFSKN